MSEEEVQYKRHCERILPADFELRVSKSRDTPSHGIRGIYLKHETENDNTMASVMKALWLSYDRASDMYDGQSRTFCMLAETVRFCNQCANDTCFSCKVLPELSIRLHAGRIIDAPAGELSQEELRYSGWVLLPLAVHVTGEVGHSVLIMCRDGRMVVFDSNGSAGYENPTKTMAIACAFVFNQLGEKFELPSSLLLTKNMGSIATRWLVSEGLCGAFTAWMMTIILLNPHLTIDELKQYIKYREAQWEVENESIDKLREKIKSLRDLPISIRKKLQFTNGPKKAFDNDIELRANDACFKHTDLLLLDQLEEMLKTEVDYDKYNRTVDTFNSMISKYNLFLELFSQSPLSALLGCEKMADPNNDRITFVRAIFKSIKVVDGDIDHIRKILIDRGIFLSWFEVQITIFLCYATRLKKRANMTNFWPNYVQIKVGDDDWETYEYGDRHFRSINNRFLIHEQKSNCWRLTNSPHHFSDGVSDKSCRHWKNDIICFTPIPPWLYTVSADWVCNDGREKIVLFRI